MASPAETDKHAKLKVWKRRFVESLEFPESATNRLAEEGIKLNLAPNTRNGRVQIANYAGTLFGYAFIPETGGEHLAEDLDIRKIEAKSVRSGLILREVLGLMVQENILKTKKPWKWRKTSR